MKIIGLCGPHTSGKRALAHYLAQKHFSGYVSLDEFFIPGKESVYVNYNEERFHSFERPELYDGKRLASVIKELDEVGAVTFDIIDYQTDKQEEVSLEKAEYLFVEGFLLYQYPELRGLITHKFYLDLSDEEIKKRRQAGDHNSDHFLDAGIEEYEQYGKPQKLFDDVIVLDGTKSFEELEKEILSHLA